LSEPVAVCHPCCCVCLGRFAIVLGNLPTIRSFAYQVCGRTTVLLLTLHNPPPFPMPCVVDCPHVLPGGTLVGCTVGLRCCLGTCWTCDEEGGALGCWPVTLPTCSPQPLPLPLPPPNPLPLPPCVPLLWRSLTHQNKPAAQAQEAVFSSSRHGFGAPREQAVSTGRPEGHWRLVPTQVCMGTSARTGPQTTTLHTGWGG
jgi:hypothetical protein